MYCAHTQINAHTLTHIGRSAHTHMNSVPVSDLWGLWPSYHSSLFCSVQITDPSESRFEVPIAVPKATEKASSPAYSVELSNEPFGIIVKRTSTGAVLYA